MRIKQIFILLNQSSLISVKLLCGNSKVQSSVNFKLKDLELECHINAKIKMKWNKNFKKYDDAQSLFFFSEYDARYDIYLIY